MASKTVKMEALEPRQLLTVGAPDPTFGVNGVATFRHIGALNQLLAEPDGKLLGIGNDLLVQFNSDGSVDGNFGSGGEITPVFTPVDAAFDSSGNIVIAATYNNDILVIRYNSEGQLHDSFGNNGVAVLDPDPGDTYTAGDVAVQSDDKIVVAGVEAVSGQQQGDLILTRLDTDSSLDSTFGTNGIVDVVPNQAAIAQAPTNLETSEMHLAITSDNHIHVASVEDLIQPDGYANQQVQVIALDPTGATVGLYGEGEVVGDTNNYELIPVYSNLILSVTSPNSAGSTAALAVQDGFTYGAFGNNGQLQLYGAPVALALEYDHSLVYFSGISNAQALTKYNADGSIDGSFAPLGELYPTLNHYSISFHTGDVPTVTSSGDLVVFGTVKGHLALVTLQITDSGTTNPTATITNFVPPRIGSKYAYVTVQFTQGTQALATSDVVPDGIDLTHGGESAVAGNLVSATGGGSGQPATATYVVKFAQGGVSRASNGVYQFTIAPDAIVDSSGAGNVGQVLAAYDLYVPPRNRGAIVLTSTSPLLSDLPGGFYADASE